MGHCLRGWILLAVLSLSQFLYAGPAPNESFDSYFVIDEPVTYSSSITPLDTLNDGFQVIAKAIDLLKWDSVNRPLPQAKENYNRLKHFGTWVNDPRDHNCLTTRAKVLIRDSSVPVDMNAKGCTVKKGKWYDPSVDQTFEDANFMEIDHFVPLKNAYISGAWSWSPKLRCLYANFMGNTMHLVPFNKTENRRKSDNTPDRYTPPEKKYRCEYIFKWLAIKSIWKLALNPSEASAIHQIIKDENCDVNQYTYTKQDLSQQRQWMIDNVDMCAGVN